MTPVIDFGGFVASSTISTGPAVLCGPFLFWGGSRPVDGVRPGVTVSTAIGAAELISARSDGRDAGIVHHESDAGDQAGAKSLSKSFLESARASRPPGIIEFAVTSSAARAEPTAGRRRGVPVS